MPPALPRSLVAKIGRVRILFCDVDGVLTNATVWIGAGGEYKGFHIQDGLGLRLLQRGGIRVAWVSSRPSPATQLRAEELKVDYLHQGGGAKVAAVERILDRAGLAWEDAAYVGDDVVDLGPMRRAGLAVAVANAVDDVKAEADHVTRARGGDGAVREVADLILRTQGRYEGLMRDYYNA